MNLNNAIAPLSWLASVIVLTVLVGCTSGPKIVNHGFGFNLSESPEAEVLAYRYGDANSAASWIPRQGEKNNTPQRIYVYGPMPQGETLYVKWQIKATGDVYEDTVDLRNRLPPNISEHRIYFMIKGPRLYVYLVPPESRKLPSGSLPNGPRIYRDLDVKTIYPDPSKN
jgi:hypothetical protein